jgi:hypothetical protein
MSWLDVFSGGQAGGGAQAVPNWVTQGAAQGATGGMGGFLTNPGVQSMLARIGTSMMSDQSAGKQVMGTVGDVLANRAMVDYQNRQSQSMLQQFGLNPSQGQAPLGSQPVGQVGTQLAQMGFNPQNGMPKQSFNSASPGSQPTPTTQQVNPVGQSSVHPDEAAFQQWYAGQAQRLGIDANPYAPEHKYDYYAAYKAGAGPDAQTNHWPSQFKAPDHPNRYVDGVDTITGQPVTPSQNVAQAITQPQVSGVDQNYMSLLALGLSPQQMQAAQENSFNQAQLSARIMDSQAERSDRAAGREFDVQKMQMQQDQFQQEMGAKEKMLEAELDFKRSTNDMEREMAREKMSNAVRLQELETQGRMGVMNAQAATEMALLKARLSGEKELQSMKPVNQQLIHGVGPEGQPVFGWTAEGSNKITPIEGVVPASTGSGGLKPPTEGESRDAFNTILFTFIEANKERNPEIGGIYEDWKDNRIKSPAEMYQRMPTEYKEKMKQSYEKAAQGMQQNPLANPVITATDNAWDTMIDPVDAEIDSLLMME